MNYSSVEKSPHLAPLKVALLQNSITPNNPQTNLDSFAAMLSKISHCDLIVLPEVFTTGFCSGARNFAETVDGNAYTWMAQHARKLNAVITGSLVVKEGEQYFNRMLWMRPDGSYVHYDKRHLFRMGGEHLRYQAGTERVLIELNGWKILPLVCYDLRFPVWSRNQNDYDLAIYVANWPTARISHWKSLLQARAIENLSYVIGVNRVGVDEAGQDYSGDSVVHGPLGETLVVSQSEEILYAELLHEHLQNYRKKFPAFMDADEFELK